MHTSGISSDIHAKHLEKTESIIGLKRLTKPSCGQMRRPEKRPSASINQLLQCMESMRNPNHSNPANWHERIPEELVVSNTKFDYAAINLANFLNLGAIVLQHSLQMLLQNRSGQG